MATTSFDPGHLAMPMTSVDLAVGTRRRRTSPPTSPPDDLRCALSGELLQDPVRAADGRAYDRLSLADAIARGDVRVAACAVANAPLFSDYDRRAAVDAWRAGEEPTLDDEGVSTRLHCPIGMVPFEDPVVASDGHTYDLAAIERVRSTDGRSPFTRQPLAANFIRNRTVDAQVAAATGRESLGHRPAWVIAGKPRAARRTHTRCPMSARVATALSSFSVAGVAGAVVGASLLGPMGAGTLGFLAATWGLAGAISLFDHIEHAEQ